MAQKFPFLLALLGMVSGVFIAILFGVNEGIFQDKIARDLQQNEKINQITDPEKKITKLEKESAKNWRYYQRFHFHATAISAMSIGVLLLLSWVGAPTRIKLLASYMVSIGGFLYPFVWLFAALYGPLIGRSAAKERFAVFGYMGGVFLLGIAFSLFLIIKYPLQFEKAPT